MSDLPETTDAKAAQGNVGHQLAIFGLVGFSTLLAGLLFTLVTRTPDADLEAGGTLASQSLAEPLVLPEFTLTERSGRPIHREDLDGKVIVCGFVFTNCPGSCLMVTGVMARLQSELPKEVQFASFSVDPSNDTPEALRRYARRLSADLPNWWFLTGDRDAMYRLIRDGFRLSVAENPSPAPGEEPISHSTRLAVVDGQGRIRGYYESSDAAAMDALKRKVKQLLQESHR